MSNFRGVEKREVTSRRRTLGVAVDPVMQAEGWEEPSEMFKDQSASDPEYFRNLVSDA